MPLLSCVCSAPRCTVASGGQTLFFPRPWPDRQGSPMTRSILHPELLLRVLSSGDDILLLPTCYRSVSFVQPKIILTRLMQTRQSPIRFTLVHGTYTYPFPSIPLVSHSRLYTGYTVMPKLTESRNASGKWSCPGWQFFSWILPAVLMAGQGVPSCQLYSIQIQQHL